MQISNWRKFLLGFIFISAIGLIWVYSFVVKANGDNVEHLHYSWRIWQGDIPYRDFFQHHNPLLWYLSAPFVNLLIDNHYIFSIFNVISYLTVLLMIYFQYKIVSKDTKSEISALVMAAILVTSYSILWALSLRPDTFMYMCLMMGLYYQYKYEKEAKLFNLTISFLCFFISIMFTQKALLNLVIPGLWALYNIAIGKIKITDFLWACLLPIMFLGTFIAYLYNYKILDLYWISNFTFNMYIPEIFEENKITFPPLEFYEFYIFIPTGTIASLYCLYKGTTIEKIISLMFLEEGILRIFYFSAFLHYSIFWLILGVMITVMFLKKLPIPEYILKILIIVYLGYSVYYNYEYTYKKEMENINILNGNEYCFYELTPCDYAINGYYASYNLKAKDGGYYGTLLGQIDVLGEKLEIAPRDNLNDIIREKKPKVISVGPYWDTYWEQRGKQMAAHAIDPILIDMYYEPSGYGDIFVLKPQYQKHNCQYIGGKWEYID